jgi:hypothetical protein
MAAMRDPWFPISLMLIVALLSWLSILGPLDAKIAESLKAWQTLIAAGVALLAAWIAWKNVGRQIANAATLEAQRRVRKHSALRAVLPLDLSSVLEYTHRTTAGLRVLLEQVDDGLLPRRGIRIPNFPSVPADTIQSLAEFIEYSDALDPHLIETLISRIQIQESRVRSMTANLSEERSDEYISEHTLIGRIIDAAAVYARGSVAFDYARRRSDDLPLDVDWEAVRSALRNMRIWQDDFPKVYETIDRFSESSAGPSP